MILTQHAARIITADYKTEGYIQITAVRLSDDSKQVGVRIINLSPSDQEKLVEMINSNPVKPIGEEMICPGLAPGDSHTFVHRTDSQDCSVCGRTWVPGK